MKGSSESETSLEVGCTGCLGTVVASGVCAVAGGFLGIGVGYVVGNVVDYVPLVKELAPTIADYVGFQKDVNINENFYQLAGGVVGFYEGLKRPWNIWFHLISKGKY